ncbi:MAG: DUF3768 domain-containing protein [Pseudomonadota bacterium]
MPNLTKMTGDDIAAAMETLTVAWQNDQFRMALLYGETSITPEGRARMTAAMAARPVDFQVAALGAVALDTTFTEDNDPDKDRTFGTVTVRGERLFWKINLYDEAYEWASPAPADKTVTRRVLTIMVPSEY